MMDKIITNHEFSRLISVSSSALLRLYASTLLRFYASAPVLLLLYSPLPGAKKRREKISLALLVVVSSSSL